MPNQTPDFNALDSVLGLMHQPSGKYAHAQLQKLRRRCPECVRMYLLGVYYLEFGRCYPLPGGHCIEGKVSQRRARRYLQRALRGNDTSEIRFTIGESYAREFNYAEALKCFSLAQAEKPANLRYLWSAMEMQYLLGKPALAYDLYQRHGRPGRDGRSFWIRILAAYAAAQCGYADDLRRLLRAIGDQIPADAENADVAAASLAELHFLAGDETAMRAVHARYAESTRYIATPCAPLFEEAPVDAARRAAIRAEILSQFTPLRLVSRLDDADILRTARKLWKSRLPYGHSCQTP